jgi:hypothetical protein
MKRFWSILTVCLLACTLGFAQDAPAERNLPQIQPAPCTVPAQIQGQAAVDEIIADIEEAGKYVQGVQGGCGSWDLTKKQRKNLGKLLLEDDIPFGTTATIGCSQTFELDETTSVVGHMVIGVRLDADGEVVVIFVAAGE